MIDTAVPSRDEFEPAALLSGADNKEDSPAAMKVRAGMWDVCTC